MMLEEQMYVIGNSIVKKMTEMNLEALSSQGNEAKTSIRSEFWIPATIGGNTYTIKLSAIDVMRKSILLETSSDPYIIVEVPFSSDIKIADNSTVYSSDYKYVLKYENATILFENGGVPPDSDNNPPIITIISPPDGNTINITKWINVSVYNDLDVTRVEYFVGLFGQNDPPRYNYTGRKSFNWYWDTTTFENGRYNVTAKAYHASGKNGSDTKTYNISNTGSVIPVVTVLSPANNSSTPFRKPVIQVLISDNKGRNLSSSLLFVDNVSVPLNPPYHLENQKLTMITYNNSTDMSISKHNISLQVIYNGNLLQVKYNGSLTNTTNWSFNITQINDKEKPNASIIYPVTNASLVSGSPISVIYNASDASSGISNLSINVTRDDGIIYYHIADISEYPTVVNSINPPEIWTFPDNYVGNRSYSYNITVFDRNGTKNYSKVVNLTVPPGQDSQLEVVTSGKTLTNSNKMIGNITLRDSSPFDPMVVTITKINVSWVLDSGEHISRVKFDAKLKWNSTGSYTPGGVQFSGNWLTLNQYTVPGSPISMGLEFDMDVSGKAFTMEFLLSDNTKKTVTFNT
jgi:hypothetical protein